MIAVTGVCALGIPLLLARSLDYRQLELSPGTLAKDIDAGIAASPSAEIVATHEMPDREHAPVFDAAVPSPTSLSSGEPLSPKTEDAVRSLVQAQDFAASFPGEGPLELSKSTAELALIQACVGHVLAQANRGIEASGGVELSQTRVADDEVKFFHAGKMFIVRRGEFPIYDEARDRVAADIRPPRSPSYYQEYQALFSQALSSLGVPEAR